jgi:hypothetical protein
MLGTSPMPERSATRTGPLLTGASPGDLKAGGDETTGLAVANPALPAVRMPAWPTV